MPIIFLTLEQVIQIHGDQIERYGGDPGLRDAGLLEAAVAMPQSGFGGEYFHEFPHEMAAAYLFHLTKNHAFVDGNKRVGLASSLIFLDLNKLLLDASKDEAERITLAVAAGEADKATTTAFFRKHVKKRRSS